MARLNNTTSPRKRTEPRRVPQPPTKARQGLSESPLTRNNNEGQWAMASETRSTKSSAPGMLDLKGNSITRKPSQKTGKNKKKGSGGDFPIFNDGDDLVENEVEETEDECSSASPSSSPFSASSSSTGTCPSHDEKTKNPLKLARTNSLLLPLSQQGPSRRQTRKSELYDYAKENDPVEQADDDSVSSLTRSSSDASSWQSPVRRNTRQTPQSQRFSTYRQRETEVEDPDDSEDNGFDSMDDFVVSDNEEVSFNESSGSETEEEKAPSPPPQPKRRLFRGRRPAPKPESEPEKVEEAKKQREVPPYREQSPIEDTMPPLKSDPKHTQLSQKSLNITDKLNNLNLEDNGSSCQLARELNE